MSKKVFLLIKREKCKVRLIPIINADLEKALSFSNQIQLNIKTAKKHNNFL